MEQKQEILDVIYSVVGYDYHRHDTDKCQIVFNCPNCDNERNKGKLEINYNKLVAKCWSCEGDVDGIKGSLYKFIKDYGNNRELSAYREATKDHIFNNEVVRKKDYIPDIRLPKHYKKIKPSKLSYDDMQPYNYLKGRGISDEIIIKNEIGYCDEGYYGGRIIIPSYSKEGKLNFFVGRTYTGQNPKYLNPTIIKTEVVINELNINWDSTIYIVEGLFDMISLEIKNTIPLLGKVMTIKTFEEIIEKANGYVVIMLDPDAKLYAYKIYNMLDSTHLHDKIRVIDLPLNMDISDIRQKYGKKGVLKCLTKARKLTIDDYIENNITD